MKVSSNAKYRTEKKAEKFWNNIHLHYNELITTANKINKSNKEYIPVKCHNPYSIARKEGFNLLFKNFLAS